MKPGRCAEHGGLMWDEGMRACITPDDVIRGGCIFRPIYDIPGRPDWDAYFLIVARSVSLRADCTRRKVGVVVVDAQHRIISTGYNGAAAGAPGCASDGACPRGTMTLEEHPSYVDGNHDFSNCIAVHAEANALLYADGRHTRGATLYSTDKPCAGCERLIEGAGIIRVVHP